VIGAEQAASSEVAQATAVARYLGTTPRSGRYPVTTTSDFTAAENEAAASSGKERDMSGRLLITSAVMLVIAGPAFGDCNQEIQNLNEAVTQAETGASSAGTGLPATPHQEQVLAGEQKGETGATGQSGAGQADVPASPHQQQVLAGTQTGEDEGKRPADLIAEARDMAKTGDEEGCMQKIDQVKSLLGLE
jgi:hypothetical protein